MDRLYAKIDLWFPRWSFIKKEPQDPIYIDFQCVVVSPFSITHIMDKDLVLSPPVQSIGHDQWGHFYNLTGHEKEGYCFWCGAKVGRRYCFGKGHRARYWEQYVWSSASLKQRRGHQTGERDRRMRGDGTWHYLAWVYFCDDCGHEGGRDDFQVHHIQPMMGHSRAWHWLNRQDNLTHLCHDCHKRRHKELRDAWQGVVIPKWKSGPVLDGQMEFRF